jgi:hypothetical protein
MTTTYNTVTQLVPACLYTGYKQVESTILGTTTECNTTQFVLTIISMIIFTILCIGSSIIYDDQVVFVSSLENTWISKNISSHIVHVILSTIAYLTLLFFSIPTFTCLFGTHGNDDVLLQSLPLLISTSLIITYSYLFRIPTPSSTQTIPK